MVQVNRVYLKILVINRPQFLVDSNDKFSLILGNDIVLGPNPAGLMRISPIRPINANF